MLARPELADGEFAGGSDYTYMIYSSTHTRWWPLHGWKKHRSSSPTTMADGGDGAAVRRPTPAKAKPGEECYSNTMTRRIYLGFLGGMRCFD